MGKKVHVLIACLKPCYSVITAGRLRRNQKNALEKKHYMASFDYKKLKRSLIIYRVVQLLLLCLLVVVAYFFQSRFAMMGTPEKFMYSIKITIMGQLLAIYPIYRLAWRDASVEIAGSAIGLTKEDLAALRKKRLLGDLWKFSAVAFFLAFVTMVPDAKKAAGVTPVLAGTLFSFLLMCLTYFQCFNFSAKKQMKQSV
jgi:hypothetical protein